MSWSSYDCEFPHSRQFEAYTKGGFYNFFAMVSREERGRYSGIVRDMGMGWRDLAQARLYTKSVNLQRGMQEMGVVGVPEVRFLEGAETKLR